MGFFQTKDPKTGEPRLGAGVYLIICAAMIGAAVLWNVRRNANEPALGGRIQEAPKATNPSNLAPVAQAAKDHQDATASETPPGVAADTNSPRDFAFAQQPSQNSDVGSTDTQPDSLDTIQNTMEVLRQSREKADKEKAEALAKAQAEADAKIAELKKKALVTSSAENAPTTSPNAGRPGTRLRDDSSGNEVSTSALVVYDARRDRPAKPVVTQPTPQATGFDTKDFLPRGFFFPVYTLTTVQTVNQEDLVILGVAENVIFQHKVQLPFGTRLLGTAAASNFEDRVSINVDTILYPDGRELPISAFLKDASDLASGVRGYYIPQPLRVQLTPYINEFIAAWTQAATNRYSNIRLEGSNNDGQVSTSGAEITANLIRQQAQRIQARLDRRFPEKVVVPIGTKAYVQLRSPLDLSRARVAGSLDNNQPILPGFENNPISASGQVERAANRPATGQLTNQISPAPIVPQADLSAARAQSAQQAQSYLQALQQLNTLERQIQSSRSGNSSRTPATSPSPAVNWPEGDIE